MSNWKKDVNNMVIKIFEDAGRTVRCWQNRELELYIIDEDNPGMRHISFTKKYGQKITTNEDLKAVAEYLQIDVSEYEIHGIDSPGTAHVIKEDNTSDIEVISNDN